MKYASVLLFLFVVLAHGNDPFDEDWEMVAWDSTGVGGVVWEESAPPPVVNSTATDFVGDYVSVFEAYNSSDDAVWRPSGNVSLEFNSAENILTSGPVDTLVDFAFSQQERGLYDKLNALIDDFIGLTNRTEFVTFVTLMPLRCSEVHKVAALFDAAMRESNPGSEITSIAQRLGSAACGVDGACPCKDTRRYSERVMELQSTSRKRALQPPAHFPYPVEIRES
jgi:hypothetical protein